jgi:oligopeptide transport system substrate-binding protein
VDPALTLPVRRSQRTTRLAVATALVVVLGIVAPLAVSTPVQAAREDARIVISGTSTFDPAAAGDSGSAEVDAQLFETLTAFDSGLTLRPALAASWQVLDGGRRVTFTLRDRLRFSDGTPLTSADVVRSWLRLLDPAHPSPLASLLDEVEGAVAYRTGAGSASAVGFSTPDQRTVDVTFSRPQSDFPAIVSSPSFGIVPDGVSDWNDPTHIPVSGGYSVTAVTPTEITLAANDAYWAGRPAIQTIHLVEDLGGQTTIGAFLAGNVDYTPISPVDAGWVAYDRTLGSQLRSIPSMTVTYFGFDTTHKPFDDPRVREAFAKAVDWKRLATLGSFGDTTPATSMVPPGVPGRSDSDFLPAFDPAAARADLAAAGYPGGQGFPSVTLVTGGTRYDGAIVQELKTNLGVTVDAETMEGDAYFTRLETDPPAFWSLSWVADYPGANDFLGMLLGTGATANYGRWSSSGFDAAIADALAATDQTAAQAAYDRAQTIVRQEAPVIPVDYSQGWALSAPNLLGAGENGLSIMRMAGLAWGS